MTLNTDTIDFGSLKYKTKAIQELTLTNEGEGNGYFHFLPKPEDQHISKRMFNVTTAYGVVQPGETMTVQIEAFIDSESAHVKIE